MRRFVPLTLRILEKIRDETAGGCWPWMGAKTRGRYGHIKNPYTGKHARVIRLVCPEINETTEACHSCDNPECVNPEHLFAGTRSDNMQDAATKGRLPGSPGPRDAKTSIADRQKIRERYAAGESQQQLAEAYGVQQARISQIVLGKHQRRYRKYHPPEIVSSIREQYTAGARQVDLAKLFGLAQSTISRIVRGISGNSERREAEKQ
ncbi:MAG TPA: HNH endonuclease [Hyphomicrobiaceae bacterium]|nr:HNH endonuclease [Hyphomicrobiaceae bacterium]